MSIKLLDGELSRFLASPDPEVICLTGKWGVGKTYAWKFYLEKAQKNNAVELDKYSYISLFGRNSLEDVRMAIVENTVDSRKSNLTPNLSSYEDFIKELRGVPGLVSKLWNRFSTDKSYATFFYRLLFLSLKRQIICIDDLERRGHGIQVVDIFGLISELKDQKACKIVLLLNRDEMEKTEKDDFERHLEKIVDTIIKFEPTSVEAIEIGINKDFIWHSILSARIQALGVVNIRVIKKIENFCHRAFHILRHYDERIIKQAIFTLSLAVFAKLQPDDAPPLNLIKSYNRMSDAVRRISRAEDENSKYKDFLKNYGFSHLDEFDTILVEGVERGFFDDESIKREAEKFQSKLQADDNISAFHRAWRVALHESFDDNQDAALDEIDRSFRASVKALAPHELGITVQLFKDLDRTERAKELIQYYVDTVQEGSAFWDLTNHSFPNPFDDIDIIEAFKTKRKAGATLPDPLTILQDLGDMRGWTDDMLDALDALSAEEYFDILNHVRGENRKNVLAAAIRFYRRLDDATAETRVRSIGEKIKIALRQIANKNSINVKRLSILGVEFTKV